MNYDLYFFILYQKRVICHNNSDDGKNSYSTFRISLTLNFRIPTDNNLSPYKILELIILKITRYPINLEVLTSANFLLCNAIGQLHAAFSVIYIILHKLFINIIPFFLSFGLASEVPNLTHYGVV